MTRAGSPHSDTLGSQPASRLPEAYRRPPRPSSAPDAKASTERPKKQNTNPTKDKQTTDHTPTTPTTTHQESRKKKEGRGPRHTKNKDTRVHYTDHNQPTHRSTHQHTTSRTPHRPHQGALPQTPDSMPPPHTQGHPPPPIRQQRACFLHQAPDKPTPPARTNPRDTVDRPAFRKASPPAGPDPFNSLSKIKRPGSHPHNQSLERR